MIKLTDQIPNARLSNIVTSCTGVQPPQDPTDDDLRARPEYWEHVKMEQEHAAMANELISARQALKIYEQEPMERCATALERMANFLEGAGAVADAAEEPNKP